MKILFTTLSNDKAWKLKDRVAVRIKKNEWYLGEISKIKAGKVTVDFFDGDEAEVSADFKFLKRVPQSNRPSTHKLTDEEVKELEDYAIEQHKKKANEPLLEIARTAANKMADKGTKNRYYVQSKTLSEYRIEFNIRALSAGLIFIVELVDASNASIKCFNVTVEDFSKVPSIDEGKIKGNFYGVAGEVFDEMYSDARNEVDDEEEDDATLDKRANALVNEWCKTDPEYLAAVKLEHHAAEMAKEVVKVFKKLFLLCQATSIKL